VAASAPVPSEPTVVLAPLHAPLAVQLAALVEFQLSVDVPPGAMLEGFALNVTVGAVLSCRTSMALTQDSPVIVAKTRLSVASVVTVNVRSPTVFRGTEKFARTTCPSAVTWKTRKYGHCVQDSRNRSVTSTCPGVAGMA
jgi:hypothetical protein